MSAYSTSSPSTEQTRLYLIRPPSAACTWLKRMSLSSVAEYSFTPMLTNPKETAPFQIDRMFLSAPVPPPSQDRQDRRVGAAPAGRTASRRPCGVTRRTSGGQLGAGTGRAATVFGSGTSDPSAG